MIADMGIERDHGREIVRLCRSQFDHDTTVILSTARVTPV